MNKLAMIALCFALVTSAKAVDPKLSDAAKEFKAINKEWTVAQNEYARLSDAANTAAKRKLLPDTNLFKTTFADRFLKFSETHPGTKEELAALCWASLNVPDSDAGKKATTILLGGKIANAVPDDLFYAYNSSRTKFNQDPRPFIAATLACAKKSLDHPQTPRLLAWVCSSSSRTDFEKPPEAFVEAAELITSKFAADPGISHFCESLIIDSSPPWVGRFEKHLQLIVEKNKTPLVMATSRYALAAVVRSGGVDTQSRAAELYSQFIAEYDGKARPGVESTLLAEARHELKEIQNCGLGNPAKAIDGEDIDGKPLKLSDHKGKVVLLVFWSSTCGPCLKDVPHEIELVEKFKGRPFVLLGVNCDSDKNEALLAAKKAGMTWQSFWDGIKGGDGPISSAYVVGAWPTLYLIDHAGVIRENRLRGKRLDGPLETYIAKAEAAAKADKC